MMRLHKELYKIKDKCKQGRAIKNEIDGMI